MDKRMIKKEKQWQAESDASVLKQEQKALSKITRRK
jgi:hypothetical protein